MKNLKNWQTTQTLLAAAFAVLALSAQSTAQTPNSALSSPNSATRASEASERRLPACTHSTQAGCLRSGDNIINACSAAVDELAKTRLLADALELENKLLNERLETEKQHVVLLSELKATRKSENEALRTAIAAKNETIAAKDVVIVGQDKLVEALKQKKTSPWKRIGDVLLGAAVFAILK